MSRYITKNFKQTIVYWGNPQPDGFGGFSFDDPVEIKGRWEDRQELFIDAQGNEIRSQAVVYLAQDVDLGGYLYLGDLDDFSSSAPEPTDSTKAKEIRALRKIPNLKCTAFLRKVWL